CGVCRDRPAVSRCRRWPTGCLPQSLIAADHPFSSSGYAAAVRCRTEIFATDGTGDCLSSFICIATQGGMPMAVRLLPVLATATGLLTLLAVLPAGTVNAQVGGAAGAAPGAGAGAAGRRRRARG